MKIQDIALKPRDFAEVTAKMYCRANVPVTTDADGGYVFPKRSDFDYYTYFNSFSIKKWHKYTNTDSYSLVLEGKGRFMVELFGHGMRKDGSFFKEIYGSYEYDLRERTQIAIPYPDVNVIKASVVGFFIRTKKKTTLYDAYYDAAVLTAPNDIYIDLVTTTFRKEDYVRRNMALLKKELFSDPVCGGKFAWNIIDNGSTLPEQTDESKQIRIYHNKNVGGAGGFAKGMMVSLRQARKPSHILLMDDDVEFSVDSFRRVYMLLSYAREEYRNHFIAGAMLKMGEPNIQHEDIGVYNPGGWHEALKPNYDLCRWDQITANECFQPKEERLTYSAWWFCCIPATVARLDNLPLPVFVRGDDMEYSARNEAQFITMQGICIWHEGFEGKFSASLEFYQVSRNDLVISAADPHITDCDFIGHIKELFWVEMYKFNYKGAALLLDAIEDFLKGPDYICSLDGAKRLGEARAKDNQLTEITEHVRSLIDPETLYQWGVIEGSSLLLYNKTINGQKRIPECFAGSRETVIPYGFGYDKAKLYRAKTVYAVDMRTNRYTTYVRDRKRFRELEARFERLTAQWDETIDDVRQAYRNAAQDVTKAEFWDRYLAE